MRRHFVGQIGQGLLLSLLICASTVAQEGATYPHYPATTGAGRGGGSGTGIAIGAGVAAAGALTYYELKHHLSTITGCVEPSGDGIELANDKDQKVYAILGDSGVRPPLGERVELKGKKRTEGGKSTFEVRKLTRNLGSCSEVAFDPFSPDQQLNEPTPAPDPVWNTPERAQAVDRGGPQFASVLSMSHFQVVAFVRGNWPMALYYQLDRPGAVQVRVEADGVQPLFLRLEAPDRGRHMEVLRIPERFGSRAIVARYSVAVESAKDGSAPRLRVYGFGAGSRAVGSIHIDRLRFEPGDIHPAQHEEAAYSFHTLADFKKVAAEFLRVGLANGEIMTVLANEDVIGDGLHRGASESGNWSGEDRHNRISVGQHLLQVRAWESLESSGDGGDWVAAWSESAVRVE